jgi:8-oxo-dGTP pyrophosphatase MutT (NUDIX family)
LRGYFRHVAACNSPLDEVFLPWLIDAQVVGCIRPAFARQLRRFADVFQFDDDEVRLDPGLRDFAARSAALEHVARELAASEIITTFLGEPYAVTPGGRESAVCVVDRAAAAYFGVRSFGQHLNGYVRGADGIRMWVGRRARDRLLFPGALDNMVAGGLPHALTLEENLVKESAEEAAIPERLARKAVPVGAISYNRITQRGFRRDVLYCYDLEVPDDFVPCNMDGEVEEFILLPLAEIAAIVRETDDFKLNCNLVVIDFLIRHGWLGPESPEYLALVTGLRNPLAAADNLVSVGA